MRAAEYECVDLRVAFEECVQAFPHEVVGSGRVELIIFDQGYPHRAGHSRQLRRRVNLGKFHRITARADRPDRTQESDVVRLRQARHGFDRGADHAQYAAVRIACRQIILLQGAERFGRSRVAGQYDQWAAALKERFDRLKRVLVDHLKRVRTIRSARVIAQIQIIILGQQTLKLSQDGHPPVAGVEDAYRSRGRNGLGAHTLNVLVVHARKA